jgi:hypothetical protein
MIGVILAFLVSRIISEGSDYDRLEYDGQALIDESIDLKARINSMDFRWHDSRVYEDHDFDKAGAVLIGLHNASDESKIAFIKQELPRIYYPENFVGRLNRKINATIKEAESPTSQSMGAIGAMRLNIPMIALKPPNPMLWQRLKEFEDDFENVSFRVQSVIRRHKSLSRALQRNISDMNSLSGSLL